MKKLESLETKLCAYRSRREEMNGMVSQKASDLIQRVYDNDARHQEEMQDAEEKRLSNFYASMQKRKRAQRNAMKIHQAEQATHEETLATKYERFNNNSKSIGADNNALIKRMRRKERQLKEKLAQAEEERNQEILMKREMTMLTERESQKIMDF